MLEPLELPDGTICDRIYIDKIRHAVTQMRDAARTARNTPIFQEMGSAVRLLEYLHDNTKEG